MFLPLYLALFTSAEENQLFRLDHIKNIRFLLLTNHEHERIQIKGCIIMQLINSNMDFISNPLVTFEITNVIRDAMNRWVVPSFISSLAWISDLILSPKGIALFNLFLVGILV